MLLEYLKAATQVLRDPLYYWPRKTLGGSFKVGGFERQLFSLGLISMQAWLLALLVLIGVCAIGAYYVHNTPSGIYDSAEGFDSSGNVTVALRRTAQLACEKDFTSCLEKGIPNKTCTTAYNVCNTDAQALSTAVSTTSAPGSATLSSAPGALAYAKAKGMTGAGDAVEWAKSGDMLKWQYGTSENIDPKMKELRDKIENGYKPGEADFNAAQNLGNTDTLSEYSSRPQKIKPHETPAVNPRVITATLKSDQGTDADLGHHTGMASLRSQIRRDVRDAVREEMEEINNEYEIRYE